ncbi:carboxylesterase/lipase family protein [Thalassotalea sp. HSM 43]|uniref:carboxylesterase/lipase family protein n=1 Tax=Thalassotalea sp. HSM 43 TaxID=2552945 RepID=UPI001080F65D|nr:carboxylesterase family protein [Thalassotalea sp. HSM 43]QBY05871.1 carboxylesterase/lipase family protein [Thalassotalea sp. HSM 43]
MSTKSKIEQQIKPSATQKRQRLNNQPQNDTAITTHLGIAYAALKTNTPRWSSSQVRSTIEQTSQSFGNIAPQTFDHNPLLQYANDLAQSEDCLNLNIYAPQSDKKLPVMVWIHGGGFLNGAGSQPIYDAKTLAANANVVVVTINYRLGVLGYLRLCDVSNNKIQSTGNEGLGDQITALKWVKKHIHAFSGDANNVTVFGESAGAMSIACLLASPLANTLFHKAILQSGAAHTYATKEQANRIAQRFVCYAEQQGYSLDDLTTIPSEKIMSLQQGFLTDLSVYKKFGILPFKPVIDGTTLTIAPHEAIAQGNAKHITLISGTNSDEWAYFAALLGQNITTDKALLRSITSLVGEQNIEQCLALTDQQISHRQHQVAITPQDRLNEVLSEYWFGQPSHRLLDKHISAGGHGYGYKLSRRSVIPSLGCPHIADIGLVFGNLDKAFYGSEPRVAELSRQMQSYWAAIAYLDPISPYLKNWPSYKDNGTVMVLHFGHDQTKQQQVNDETIAFWQKISDQQLASF